MSLSQPRFPRHAALILLFTVSFSVAVGLRWRFDTDATMAPALHEVRTLPDRQLARLASLGMDEMWADLYLVQAQLYMADFLLYGSHGACDTMAHYLDLVTTLDPRYRLAYRLGRVSIGQFCDLYGVADYVALLRRGIENPANARACYLHSELGWQYYMRAAGGCEQVQIHFDDARALAHRWPEANAKWADQECSENLVYTVRSCKEQRGADDCDRAKWACTEANLGDAKSEDRHKRMMRRICEGYRHLCALNKQLVPTYKARAEGRCPTDIPELWRALGVRESQPIEPFGGEYVVNPSTCTFQSSTGLRPRPGDPLD